MSKYARIVLAAVGATVLLGALVGTTSANRLSTSSQRFTATWSPMEFTEPFGTQVNCPVTLEGSFHYRTMVKAEYALIGRITEAVLENEECIGGKATILTETLPWHVKYSGFEGTLPRITGVTALITGASFQIERRPLVCLYTTTEAQHASGRFNLAVPGGGVTSVTVGGRITSNNNCGPFGERVPGRLGGTSNTVTALTITLI